MMNNKFLILVCTMILSVAVQAGATMITFNYDVVFGGAFLGQCPKSEIHYTTGNRLI